MSPMTVTCKTASSDPSLVAGEGLVAGEDLVYDYYARNPLAQALRDGDWNQFWRIAPYYSGDEVRNTRTMDGYNMLQMAVLFGRPDQLQQLSQEFYDDLSRLCTVEIANLL